MLPSNILSNNCWILAVEGCLVHSEHAPAKFVHAPGTAHRLQILNGPQNIKHCRDETGQQVSWTVGDTSCFSNYHLRTEHMRTPEKALYEGSLKGVQTHHFHRQKALLFLWISSLYASNAEIVGGRDTVNKTRWRGMIKTLALVPCWWLRCILKSVRVISGVNVEANCSQSRR